MTISKLPLSFSGGGGGSGGSDKVIGQFTIDTPVEKDYAVMSYALYSGTINGVYGVKTTTGTCDYDISINGTPVTNLTSVGVTTSPTNTVATGANVFAIGDRITFTVSNNSSAADLEGAIDITIT